MTWSNGEAFRDKMSEWRGYALRALEDIDADLKRLFEYHENMASKLEAVNKRVNKLYLKVVGVAVVVGTLAGFIFDLAKDVIIKVVSGG